MGREDRHKEGGPVDVKQDKHGGQPSSPARIVTGDASINRTAPSMDPELAAMTLVAGNAAGVGTRADGTRGVAAADAQRHENKVNADDSIAHAGASGMSRALPPSSSMPERRYVAHRSIADDGAVEPM